MCCLQLKCKRRTIDLKDYLQIDFHDWMIIQTLLFYSNIVSVRRCSLLTDLCSPFQVDNLTVMEINTVRTLLTSALDQMHNLRCYVAQLPDT